MGKTKSKLVKILILIFLTLFPFGQLFRKEIGILGINITLHPVDISIGLVSLVLIIGKFAKPKIFKTILALIAVLLFSLVLSLADFGPLVAKGAFYFLRFIAYLFFVVAVYNVSNSKESKKFLSLALILISLVVGIFGWFQYIFYPDLRSLYYLGWDDHLYRLVGTFLDPGFTSIILVFGFLLSVNEFLQGKKKIFLVSSFFFIVTVAFTYARAA